MSKPKFVSKQEKKMQKAFRILIATLLVCGALSVGSIVGVMAQTFNFSGDTRLSMNPFTLDNPRTGGNGANSGQALDPMALIQSMFSSTRRLDRRLNILILGSDYNYSYGKRVDDKVAGVRSRTDTIMVASLDPSTQEVNILSIPRDTRTLLTGHHYDKINAAMTYGGVDLVKSTVSDLVGIPIDYYMALKVDGLVNTIDILGGIRIYVEKDMYYVDETAHLGINIHKGWKERMNGEQAHQYIRFRKDELGDIGRVQRQQKFIRAALDKLLQPQTLLKLPTLLKHLNENIETDLPSDVILQLANFGRSIERDKVRMVMLPGTFANISGISYWEPNPYELRKIINQMFPDSTFATLPDPNPTENTDGSVPEQSNRQYRVAIWNATKDLPTVREVSRRLQEAGYTVVSVRRAPHDTPVTKLIAQNGETKVLSQIQQELGFKGEFVNASVGELSTDFTVLIGPDLVKHYKSVLSEEDWQRAAKQRVSNGAIMQDSARRQQQRYVKPSRTAVRAPSRVQTPSQKPSAVATGVQKRNLARDVDEMGIEPTLPKSARAGKLERTQTASTPIPIPVPAQDTAPNTVDPLFD